MSFRQIKLVFQREYMSKIRSKGFILVTLLLPVGMLIFFGVIVGISLWDTESDFTIGIADETGQLYPKLAELNRERYIDVSELTTDSLQSMIIAEEITGYILLSDVNTAGQSPQLIYGGSGGFALLNSVENDLEEVIRSERLEQADVSEEVSQIYNSHIDLNSRKLTAQGEVTEDNTVFLSAIGLLMGFIIFGTLFGYGGLLTRSVIEEKTSRIVEVIASSVKPIELLIGKMSGIAALGVTQITFWILASIGIGAAAMPVLNMFSDNDAQQPGQAEASPELAAFQLPAIDPMLFVYFMIFFLLGYLLYSTFFAAIGAAADSETDTQQFMFPIMVPIFIAYLIMFRVVENPDSSLAVISSLIPFFSPILMITRIAITDVPFWQIGLSIVLTLLTFAGALWLCAKIYKVGILSYGQSATFKELVKWIKE